MPLRVPRSPPARTRTDRQALREALVPGVPMTVRELSQMAGLAEDAVHRHLEHLVRSIEAEGGSVEVVPAECLNCGFTFESRSRTTRPGKCPQCRGNRILPPSFRYLPADHDDQG
jgi:transcriptional regulator